MEAICDCDNRHTCFEKMIMRHQHSDVLAAWKKAYAKFGVEPLISWEEDRVRMIDDIRSNSLSSSGHYLFMEMQKQLGDDRPFIFGGKNESSNLTGNI